jgi:dipeptidyl aminopeptidase/acylaminoacyl peptidase
MEPGWAWGLCILDESNLLFTINSTNQNAEIIKFNLDTQKYEFFNRSYEGGIQLGKLPKPTLHSYKTFDNRDIPFFFLKPDNFKQGEGNPILILIHGGPEGQERPTFKPELQYLVNQGIGILLPNVRGSGGYGESYGHLDDTYKRMDSVKDIEYLWKWVVESGWASKDKIAVMGGSYGGFMTLSCITVYPDLWAAAVELYGMVNMVTFFEHTASYRAQHRAYEYGDPIKDRKLLEDISAIHKIDQIVTPLLVLHGDEDPRVPMYETEQLVSEMKEAGKLVEFVRFLDEGHGFVKEPNRIKAYTSIAEFLTKYLLL